jgi:hypothetical protein
MTFYVHDWAGKVAYEAYRTHRQGKTHDGREMPAWDDLGSDIQEAWNHAGSATIDEVS